MDFMAEIENRVCRYREEADHLRTRLAHLDELIAHSTALIDEELRQSQLPLAMDMDVEGQTSSPDHQLNGSSPESVSSATYKILAQGQAKYSDLIRRITDEYPGLGVKSVPKSLSSALRNGTHKGRIQRLARGVYALSQ